jgi:hypothetical protein
MRPGSRDDGLDNDGDGALMRPEAGAAPTRSAGSRSGGARALRPRLRGRAALAALGGGGEGRRPTVGPGSRRAIGITDT